LASGALPPTTIDNRGRSKANAAAFRVRMSSATITATTDRARNIAAHPGPPLRVAARLDDEEAEQADK
jgi:hypothetical protein